MPAPIHPERFKALEDRVGSLETAVYKMGTISAVHSQQYSDMKEDISDLKIVVESLKTMILRSTIALCSSFVIAAFTIFEVFR